MGGRAEGQPAACICLAELQLLCLFVTSCNGGLQCGKDSMHGYPMVYLSAIICGGDAGEKKEAVNMAEMRSLLS